MIESARILFAAALAIGACVAAGRMVLRRFVPAALTRGEATLLAFVPGAACLSPLWFLCTWCGWTPPWLFVVAQLVVIVVGFLVRLKTKPFVTQDLPAPWRLGFLVIFALFTLLYVSHAVGGGRVPAGWTVSRFTTDLEGGLPRGVEMVLLPAFKLGGRTAAGLVRVAFLIALPWLMLAWARRAGIGIAGIFGAVFAFASPAMGFEGSSAPAGVAMATILFTLFYLLELESDAPALGLTAGFACAAGYSGFIALPYLFCVLAWKRKFRSVLVALAFAIPVASPWLVKNSVMIGNPMSPYQTALFPNPHVTVRGEKEYIRRTSTYPEIQSTLEAPLQATILGGSAGAAVGPLFLLAPFSLLVLRSAIGRRLMFATAILGVPYLFNPGTRCLAPVLPYVSLAMGVAFANSRALAPALILLHTLLSLPFVAARFSDPGTPRIQGAVLTPLIRLADAAPDPVTVLLDRAPPGRMFALSPLPKADQPREIVMAGNGAEGDALADVLKVPILDSHKPVLERTFGFPLRRVFGLRVTADTAAAVEWRVAELRLYGNGIEIARSASWRLRATANPWAVQSAFDNSPVTEWASGQNVEPGMRIEVQLGGPAELDRVVIECSKDQGPVRLELEGLDDGGNWTRITEGTTDVQKAPPAALRRAAIRELQRRGIATIVAAETDFAVPDFKERPGLWGIEEVGRAGRYRLYRILPSE